MLDRAARRLVDPVLDQLAAAAQQRNLTANQVTIAGFACGLAAMAAIALQSYGLGLLLLLANRLADGVDGALAKRNGPTDLGGYLDIVLDFLFYGAVPIGFVLADPPANAVADIITHDRIALRLGMRLNREPDVAQMIARVALLYCQLQTLFSYAQQLQAVIRNLTHGNGGGRISDEAFEGGAHID